MRARAWRKRRAWALAALDGRPSEARARALARPLAAGPLLTHHALLVLSLRELLRADGLERGELVLEALALRGLLRLAAPLALALLAPVAQHELARVLQLERLGALAGLAAAAVRVVRRRRLRLLRVARAAAAAALLLLLLLLLELLAREARRAQAGWGLVRVVVTAEVHFCWQTDLSSGKNARKTRNVYTLQALEFTNF